MVRGAFDQVRVAGIDIARELKAIIKGFNANDELLAYRYCGIMLSVFAD
jgi:hypothetical protein